MALQVGGALVVLALTLTTPTAHAYRWYDKDGTQTSGCVTCHTGFLGGNGPLHAQHRSLLGTPTEQAARCNVCHPNGGGTTPVLTYTSGPIAPLTNGFGCAGCHGLDYGETSPNSGLPKSTSYGLRQVHVAAGVTACGTAGCHAPGNLGAPDPFPVLFGENVAPPYFGPSFSILTDPCSSDQEDFAFDPDALGLDNDGDGLRDFPADPDCGAPTTTTTTTLPPFDCGAAPAPASGCVVPSKGVLLVNEKVAGKEKLKVSFTKLQTAVLPSDFGDPVAGTTTYNVCIYDSANTLRGQYTVDRSGDTCGTKPCWAVVSGKGFKYGDKVTTADGILKMSVSGGDAGKGKVVVVGKNSSATMPTGIAALMQSSSNATVQVVTSDAACFGMTLPLVKKADGLIFNAIGP
ncbi:MAG TPA: hypothetical protein VGR62_15940 [Candidatus Binatia bacterium]|jgi:hypothetical protein|nr:hypothetical protein [Candidatus Binatia bacterium]